MNQECNIQHLFYVKSRSNKLLSNQLNKARATRLPRKTWNFREKIRVRASWSHASIAMPTSTNKEAQPQKYPIIGWPNAHQNRQPKNYQQPTIMTCDEEINPKNLQAPNKIIIKKNSKVIQNLTKTWGYERSKANLTQMRKNIEILMDIHDSRLKNWEKRRLNFN